nr:ThiF family adenylyltransferase [Kofleriaceae bacterium]
MARALVVGAGGLGGPIALALGAAGIELAIVDGDVVEDSNLHRQIQFTAADLGARKAERLAALVVARGGRARGYATRWTADDADDLGDGIDLVVDGTDDPDTKFAVCDWAVRARRDYVIAAAVQLGGNVMVGAPDAACYRCLFESPVPALTCSLAGILGPVVGVIGGLAAAHAIALARHDRRFAGSILTIDDVRRSMVPRVIPLSRRAGCACSGSRAVA